MFSQPDAGWAATPLSGLAATIATTVVQTVRDAGANAPRSRQRVIGPSEIGMPCTRRMAYKLLDWPEVNTSSDPWASIVGTSVHAWMAETYEAENRRLGWQRYLIEQRLHIRGNIYGNSDLFDRDSSVRAVIDWKVVGDEQLKKYRKNGPGPQYETQGHLYGFGQEQAGEQVDNVAVVFLPRTGRIDGLHVWTAPYDRSIALGALERLDNVLTALDALDPASNPQNWNLFPATEAYCTYCAYFQPGSTDLSRGCPGATTK
ncbi:hypothetical protein ACFYY8_06365 [Streptosporangium sp. NPDC001559]|uniref:hypothetical protein n=1 Tax=Streptosporangium sp. NPDC001559 TaxID=3366187 RepID=UPI0036E63B05